MLSITVDTLVDENNGIHTEGNLSLREALGIAAGQAGEDTIDFSPALFNNGPATITLDYDAATDGTPDVLSINASHVTIEGPGAELSFD